MKKIILFAMLNITLMAETPLVGQYNTWKNQETKQAIQDTYRATSVDEADFNKQDPERNQAYKNLEFENAIENSKLERELLRAKADYYYKDREDNHYYINNNYCGRRPEPRRRRCCYDENHY